MSLIKTNRRKMPELNMASMPDLVFTVLFFFMIVTHIREVPVKVKYQTPKAQKLDRLVRKTAVTYIYIGVTEEGRTADGKAGKEKKAVVQLNDKLTGTDDIRAFIMQERERMAPEDLQKMTVNIRADKKTPMSIIGKVKDELQQAKALRIYFAADEIPEN